jgi:hypothetical protein
MNPIIIFVLMLLPLSVSAQTILECRVLDWYNQPRELVGSLVLLEDEAILFQQYPYFRSISFDMKKATSDEKTITLVEKKIEEIISLQLETKGRIRKGTLIMRSPEFHHEYFHERLNLRCFES